MVPPAAADPGAEEAAEAGAEEPAEAGADEAGAAALDAGAAAELAGAAAALDGAAAALDGVDVLDELHAAIVVARATAVAAPMRRRILVFEAMADFPFVGWNCFLVRRSVRRSSL